MKLFILLLFTSFGWADDNIFVGVAGGNVEEVTKPPLGDLGALPKCGENEQENRYVCVPYHNCDPETNTVIDTSALSRVRINIRIGAEDKPKCGHYMEVCCQLGNNTSQITTPPPPLPPIQNDTNKLVSCGIRNKEGLDFNLAGNTNEALFGEFPWMVAILRKQVRENQTLLICGGSLIAPNVVLTGAHCVNKHSVDDIRVRVGEWDTQTLLERINYQERNVIQKIIHEGFIKKNYRNNIALLILDREIIRADNVGTICLPRQSQTFNSQECYATGWGRNIFGVQGRYAVILKKIQLPLVQHESCQSSLRTTQLGPYFVLHESFVCAGGEKGVDTCKGDGGGPLVCPDPSREGRYVQVGIVSWGIGCGEDQMPGVYANVALFSSWIEEKLQEL